MNTKAKLVSALDELLLELKDGTVKPDAEPTDVFGQYLGGKERNLKETNTYKENLFLAQLALHYGGSVKAMEGQEDLLRELKAQGKYRKFLQPPPGKIFRLLTLEAPRFEDLFPDLKDVYMNDTNKIHVVKKSGVLNRNDYKIQSWTYSANRDLAEFVADGSYGNVLVIVVADANQPNVYLNWQEIPKIIPGKKELINNEKEAISFGPVNFSGFAYIVSSPNQQVFAHTKGNFFNKQSVQLKKAWEEKAIAIIDELIELPLVPAQKEGVDTMAYSKYFIMRFPEMLRELKKFIIEMKVPVTGTNPNANTSGNLANINNYSNEFIVLIRKLQSVIEDFPASKVLDGISEILYGFEMIYENEMRTRRKIERRFSKATQMIKGQKLANKEIK
ncbi:MAG: hypothetical protein ILNGONEN_01414 [Syntrophorhabdaceae bacterium]|jgi:hypothetical protein|nr:hypothetical protein [Syntrophorhabdaceae bacterium]